MTINCYFFSLGYLTYLKLNRLLKLRSYKISALSMPLKLVCILGFPYTMIACATAPVKAPDIKPVDIASTPPTHDVDGSIYRSSSNRFLFEDVRARRVGDVINVVLEERTDATKAASTSTNKATGINMPGPKILGGSVSALGREIFSNDVSSNSDFSGQADSSQSNRLSGSIAVTIVQELSNGNLWIKGQKRLTLNQGSEIVEVSGQIRPADIAPDNSVLSWQIADAQITYGGTGLLADANTAGWLTRVFQSPLWPF